jgi:cysteine desulfurase
MKAMLRTLQSVLFQNQPEKRVYLDYAGGTPLGKAGSRALLDYAKEGLRAPFGNPASTHTEGALAAKILEGARRELARTLGVQSDEIIFTGNATEANNLAILGVVRALKNKRDTEGVKEALHVITSSIEHSSILAVCRQLEKEGVAVTYLPPTKDGVVSVESVKAALTPHTALITLSYVNSELGTITPIRAIAKEVLKFRREKKSALGGVFPYIHVDGSQAETQLSLDPHALLVDFVTMDGGKCYGPKGVGALAALRERSLQPLQYGGAQERSLRPGTPSVMLIQAFVESYKECVTRRDAEIKKLQNLEKYLRGELEKNLGGAVVHGTLSNKIAGFCSVCIKELEAEFAVLQLDVRGIAVSSASACMSLGGTGSSYVVAALPSGKECAAHSLRISMGRYSTKADITRLIKALKEIVR